MAYEYGAKEPEKLKIKDMTPREKELLIEDFLVDYTNLVKNQSNIPLELLIVLLLTSIMC